jgi:hypothetical protein
LQGGFAAAHSYLCHEGPKLHLFAKNVLTDYDPNVSIFAQFERSNNTTSREKAQRSLQNMFDSGMTVLTKSTMRFEALSSDQNNTDEILKAKTEQKNVVLRLFGGAKEDPIGDKEGIPEEQDSVPTGHSQSSVPFRNPFARKSQAQSELNNSSHRETLSSPGHSDASNLDAERALADGDQSSEYQSKSETASLDQGLGQVNSSQKAVGFAGFGAAFNNSLKPSGKTQNVRNPFARFGNIGSNTASKNKEAISGQGIGNHFASLNQFRKNIMKSSDSHKAEKTVLPEPTVAELQPVDTQNETNEIKSNETPNEDVAALATVDNKNKIPLAAEIAKV